MDGSTIGSLQGLQTEILEAVASGEILTVVAALLCRRAETLLPNVLCSILTVDSDKRLHSLAAPNLPTFFSAAIEGVPIGPAVGSCGTAAFLGQDVAVTDIATDPLWADFAGLAASAGLAACWSSPVKARDGRVLGTFALYYNRIRGPDVRDQYLVKTLVHLCAIALEHEEMQSRNHRLAFYDTLTGLPNRANFNKALNDKLLLSPESFGLLLIDIDHLKAVNDTMGHAVGDALLRTVAHRIEHLGPGTVAYRLGGDEFAVLLDLCGSAAALRAMATQILAKIRLPFERHGHTIAPQASLGGVLHGEDGIDGETLRQNADFALCHAKQINRGGYVRFKEGLRTTITQRLVTIRTVDLAISQARILPYYQPIVTLATGAVDDFEALARMRTPAGAIVAAGQFHQAMTDPKVAYDLTGAMLSQVAADIRHWIDTGVPFKRIGINVTTADFLKGDLEHRILRAFGDVAIDLTRLCLEVNEAVFMGSDRAIAAAVGNLRRKGLAVALDDFGTGFASLTHLLHFPVDVIKIDKSFVDRLLVHAPSAAIVETLLDLARKLDMRVIAEGVETVEQAERLWTLGCAFGQGYHFGRPAAAADVAPLIRGPRPSSTVPTGPAVPGLTAPVGMAPSGRRAVA